MYIRPPATAAPAAARDAGIGARERHFPFASTYAERNVRPSPL
jgi:hypothetical protein